MIITENWPPL